MWQNRPLSHPLISACYWNVVFLFAWIAHDDIAFWMTYVEQKGLAELIRKGVFVVSVPRWVLQVPFWVHAHLWIFWVLAIPVNLWFFSSRTIRGFISLSIGTFTVLFPRGGILSYLKWGCGVTAWVLLLWYYHVLDGYIRDMMMWSIRNTETPDQFQLFWMFHPWSSRIWAKYVLLPHP